MTELKNICEGGLFRCKEDSLTLQVSHRLGRNRVVVKRPNTQIIDCCDFAIFSGDKKVHEVKPNE